MYYVYIMQYTLSLCLSLDLTHKLDPLNLYLHWNLKLTMCKYAKQYMNNSHHLNNTRKTGINLQ